MRLIVTGIMLLACAAGLAAQEERQVIRSLDYKIEGSTSEAALRAFTGLREGLEFPSASALAAYLDKARRALVDDRVFKSVEIVDEAEPPPEGSVEGRADGPVGHRVMVQVVDASTFVVLPDISYDSNLGLLLGLQPHYGNAFGTMANGFLDAYLVARERNGVYGFGPWDIHPRVEDIMWDGSPWTLELELRREELDLRDGGTELAAWNDLFGVASLDAKLPLGGLWYYEIQPGFAGQFGTVDLVGNGANPKDYRGPNYRHALGLGEVDWVGNFRSGYDLRLEHFVQTSLGPGGLGVSNEVSATARWYVPISFLNYYGRARAQADFDDVPVDLGKYLRGIADDSMSGTASIFLNQTLAIDLGLPRRLDLQVHPFFDIGTALPAARAWNPRADIRKGVGADILLFSDALPNIFIRLTYGLDLGLSDPFAAPEILFDTTMSY